MPARFARTYLTIVLALTAGIVVGRYGEGVPVLGAAESVLTEVEDFARPTDGDRRTLLDKLVRHRQIQRDEFGFRGFRRVDPDFREDGYLLLSRFSPTRGRIEVDLVDAADGRLLHRWLPPVEEIVSRATHGSPETNSPDGFRAQHPLLLADGSLVLGTGSGPLAKIDRKSDLVWLSNRFYHHTIEADRDGRIYAPLRLRTRDPAGPPVFNDGYAVLSPEGAVLEEHSVNRILEENGHAGLLYGIDPVPLDVTHLNDAQPISVAAGLAEPGDVALSCRRISTVFLYRPSTDEVVWLKTGPWLQQHDINLVPESGRFSIFGNDVVRWARFGTRQAGGHADVYLFDPLTGRSERPYRETLAGAGLVSETRGRCRVLTGGDVFIEESDRGRLLRVGADGVRWEYVSTDGDDGHAREHIGRLNLCRYLPATEVDLRWLDRPGEL